MPIPEQMTEFNVPRDFPEEQAEQARITVRRFVPEGEEREEVMKALGIFPEVEAALVK